MEALKTLKEQYSYNTSNTIKSSVDEGEIEDTENAQDSVSEDDSDDDSDRKGKFNIKYITLVCVSPLCIYSIMNYFYYNVHHILQKKMRKKQPWVVNWRR